MKVIFFGRGPVAQPSLQLLQQQPWCELVPVTAAADVGVVVDYGKKISDQVREQFPHGIINVHPSLLPRWRGPSPIKSALLHGDTITGVSIMQIDSGFDTGPILIQKNISIKPQETNIELEQRLALLGAELLVEILPKYVAGQIKPLPQSTQGVTISKLIQRQDGELTTQLTPAEMWNRYRAFQPWPGVFFLQDGKRYIITKAHWQAEQFVCDEIQPEGKRAMALADFKRGYSQISFADIV